MKSLYTILITKLKRWYYFQELKELSGLFSIVLVGWLIYEYGKKTLNWLFTNEGLTYLVFLLVAVILGIALKLYYRMMVIKYHEKDTRIKLFEDLKSNTTTLLILLCLLSASSTQAQHAGHTAVQEAGYADSINSGLIAKDTMKSSPRRVAMKTIGTTHVHIDYGSPGVKGRVIWGGLVAYDQVWCAGAHKATIVELTKDVQINKKKVKAGKYAFFAIPGKQQWTLILNTRWNQHLSDEYNPKEDVVRVLVKPATLKAPVQRLTYSVQSASANKGTILLQWETIGVQLSFTVIN